MGNAELSLKGYKMFRKDREVRRGGGVALYIKVECPTVWSTQRQIRPFLHMY